MAVAKRRRRNNAHQYPKVWEGKAKSSDGFVERGIDPDFEALLAGPYAGLVVEGPPSSTSYVKESLESLESLCVHDVTQPMGDALARTHVTRCLVGEPGATYKYLGLRMFAHPWRDIPQGYEPKIRSGLEGVRSLNDALSKRAETLGASKAAFTVSLLNMMAPNVGKKGTAVSWHADSCLEHGSTISVFQCVDEKEGGEKKKRKWRLGVRVRRDSEGPGRRDPTEKEITGDDTPRLAVSIPNPGVYHMLDDFNHHHQHCVLAGERGRRISSTHRVARKESHTAQWVLLLSSRKGINKAHALDVIEFEWLRQWYAQGHGHARRLSHYWRAVLDELEKHWFELERAEYVRFRALVDAVDDQTVSARRRKKMRARLESSGLGIAAYDSAIADLEQRLQKRNAWHLRETNSFWESQPEDARPILPLPFLSRSKDGSTLPIDLAGPVLQLKKARSAYVASSS